MSCARKRLPSGSLLLIPLLRGELLAESTFAPPPAGFFDRRSDAIHGRDGLQRGFSDRAIGVFYPSSAAMR